MASRTSTTPSRRYTETKVPILDSQLELKVLMQDARDVGLSEPEWQAAGGRAFVLRFRIDGRPCQVVLRPDENEDDPEAELRRLHRVLLHFVTTAIEAARSRLLRVGEALLAWHVMTNGKMLGETVLGAGQSITLTLPEAKGPATPSRALPAAKAPATPSRALPAAKAPAAPSRALPEAKASATPSRALPPGGPRRRRP
jgi:hypothetical protein